VAAASAPLGPWITLREPAGEDACATPNSAFRHSEAVPGCALLRSFQFPQLPIALQTR